ncbi:hypothetical protein BJV82DRAFT_590940 [Fennellomyces sp. T-0311]|nr:hypothetical protein BJV82DRAFT_590940 [Fennellomyces sp. T-0311]
MHIFATLPNSHLPIPHDFYILHTHTHTGACKQTYIIFVSCGSTFFFGTGNPQPFVLL